MTFHFLNWNALNINNSRPEKNFSKIFSELKIVAVVNHNSLLCGVDYCCSIVLIQRKKRNAVNLECLTWREGDKVTAETFSGGFFSVCFGVCFVLFFYHEVKWGLTVTESEGKK